jgi:IS5 family transposase
MIRIRHQQPCLWETFFAEEVAELWEPWMRVVDELLEDEELLEAVYDAQSQRHTHSRTRRRHQTPAEVVLRMLILKNVRNWSYETLEREVRSNVVYRRFLPNRNGESAGCEDDGASGTGGWTGNDSRSA